MTLCTPTQAVDGKANERISISIVDDDETYRSLMKHAVGRTRDGFISGRGSANTPGNGEVGICKGLDSISTISEIRVAASTPSSAVGRRSRFLTTVMIGTIGGTVWNSTRASFRPSPAGISSPF